MKKLPSHKSTHSHTMDQNHANRSSAALPATATDDSEPPPPPEADNRDEDFDKTDELTGSDSSSDFGAVRYSSKAAAGCETLASVQLNEADFVESSHLLSEVPVKYSLQAAGELKDQVGAVREESLKAITGQSAEVQHQIQEPDGPSKLEPVTQCISSIPNPILPEQKLLLVENGDKKNSPDLKPLSIVPMLKTPDGYNWRKYGQKQVKSPEGSRSYYRCTFSDCYAKKIECCDRSNRLIETVYRSLHNHDPPQKVNCSRENRPVNVPVHGSNDTSYPVTCVNDPVPPTPSKEPLLRIDYAPETKQPESYDSDETTEIDMKEEYADGPESKRRQKRDSKGGLEPISKPAKKPKYVVHAAGDVGISGDGYRWRKYGQKMVKGNPHPRNYYRCTSAGCPVRKHIETAVDNINAVVITYKGMHDHDTPLPRKRHGPKSASTPISLDNSQNQTKPHTSQPQWSVDKKGELTGEPLNVGEEKASKSARTLLSVGFEIKPC